MRLYHVIVLTAMLAISAAKASDMEGAPEFVGSEVCAGCHAEAAAAWDGSHHAWAWTEADPEHVLGDFSGAEFEHRGVITRFLEDPDGFVIETEGQDGVTRPWDVVGVVGVAPLQQYLLSPQEGRTQVFDVAWDADAGRWYHVFPDQELLPGDGLHWAGPYKNWDTRCAECHATGYVRNYDSQARVHAPEMVEKGVGCESCHGPGSRHVAWVGGGTGTLGFGGFDFDISSTAEGEIQQCAGCHSRREAIGDGNPQPGVPYHDSYMLSLLREGLYHSDGTIQDEVYVYGSFLQSKMYAKGVRCSDCHEPHSGELRAEGNGVCTACHSPAGNPGFPTLRKAEYDGPEHHFHQPGTEAASCMSCHMTERVYMGIDARSDHYFRVPRPDLSVQLGTPNTCTDCHEDRSAEWAADAVTAWYPASAHRGPHFAAAIDAGRRDPAAAVEALFSLAGDGEMPGIVRATALELLGPVADRSVADRAAAFLSDGYPPVRLAAVRLQRAVPPQERAARLRGVVRDSVRSVRIATAELLFDAPPPEDPALAAAIGANVAAWQKMLFASADFPETHLRIGGFGLTTRNLAMADRAFAEAVSLDPQLVDAWIMRARIRQASSDTVAARAVLDEALAVNPGQPELLEMRRELGGG